MIPKRIEMDALQWEISICELGFGQQGECRGEECQMVIASRLCEQMRESTFWHEAIHMMSRSRDLDWLEILDGQKDPEEVIARHLGAALFTFLTANCHITWKGQQDV